ncbi:hydantoinase/oxoprolinase family protein [Castellaniella sp. GW247-6E4]|uniref:hydantoinase/oxoprolinase family protein n=1 Tax=Castellaniella sp. GW247-6E4 TaxID=3140380 RepID=UPI00331489CA
MNSDENFRIGVDIGGTFTDITLMDAGGALVMLKTPSTPSAPARGVVRGITEILQKAGRRPENCLDFVHGSTIGVNTIIRRDGACVGLLMTSGFEDILELARCKMPNPFSLFSSRPLPLIRRNFVRGIRERINGSGQVVTALDPAQLEAAARQLMEQGAEQLAISFLHAYRNPVHERQARDFLAQKFPSLNITISSDIWPQIREYERTTVLTMNSYIASRVTQYLNELNAEKGRIGLHCPFYMTSSNGGLVPLQHAIEQPIKTLLSGPSSGVTATLQLMKDCAIDRAITMDIGGTSADICVLDGHHVPYAWDQEVAGLPIMLPSVDVSSIGSGGGSIAYIDNLGLLKVGPQSAGADPGPVAYDLQGTEPTLTDAYLVDGYIDPDNFLGGELALRTDLSYTAIGELGKRLRLSPEAVADGIIKISTSNLVAEISRLAAKKGLDIRDFIMVPYGGAGATQACFAADELHIKKIVIPPTPGTFSAIGAILSDFRLDYVKNLFSPFNKLDHAVVHDWFREIEMRGRATLKDSLDVVTEIAVIRAVGVRYQGQGFEVPVTFEHIDDIPRLFAEEYSRLYGPRLDDGPLEVISLRGTVVGVRRKPGLTVMRQDTGEAQGAKRKIITNGQVIECPAYRRQALGSGWRGMGPFVIDQADTTIVVTHGWRAHVDAAAVIHLEKEF